MKISNTSTLNFGALKGLGASQKSGYGSIKSHKEGGEIEMSEGGDKDKVENVEEAGHQRGPSKTSDQKKNYDVDDEYPDI